MQYGQFYSGWMSGRRPIIVLACISNLIAKRDCSKDEWVLQFDHMRGLRQSDQYSLDARPTLAEVRHAVTDAGIFIERIDRLLKTP
jgi:hypothetical protein